MKQYFTPAGKEIKAKLCTKSPLFKIEFATGGELPEELTGRYTCEREVEHVIIMYLAKVNEKVNKKNG